jgi:RNA polymerase sigma factor (sigma-70 family)
MASTPTSSNWQQRNARLLAAYASERSITNRNAVVQANLALVWQAARRESIRSGQGFEDLSQVGCLGLIKAVEQFDPAQGASLSSAALPWIVGAMRHYLRDRCQPLQGGRSLRELNQKAQALQRQRQQDQQPPLSETELVAALGCSLSRWREAQQLHHALRMASLEEPQGLEAGEAVCLREQVADPRPVEPYAAAIRAERRQLLRRALRSLERSQRRLLLGRVLQQRAWADLGSQLGLSARVAQRRFSALVELLRRQLGPELEIDGLGI